MGEVVHKRYLLLVLAVVCLLQMALALVYWKVLQPVLHWPKDRVVDVGRFPALLRRPLLDAYIANTVSKETRPLVLVLGDSEAYGAFADERSIFAHLLSQHLTTVGTFDVSFKGAHLADIEKVIDSMERHRVRPEFIILEVDFANFRKPENSDSADPDVLLSVRVPIGLAVAMATFSSVRSAYDFSQQPADVEGESESFNYMALPKDVFPLDPSPAYDAALKRLLVRAKVRSKNVVAYIPPYAVDAFGYYGFDEPTFRKLVDYYLGVCRESGARCLDLSGALPLSNFLDIIHLNKRGHGYLAGRLEQEIAPQVIAPLDRPASTSYEHRLVPAVGRL
jgi:hypothetical protein